jgi:hypothetical protein
VAYTEHTERNRAGALWNIPRPGCQKQTRTERGTRSHPAPELWAAYARSCCKHGDMGAHYALESETAARMNTCTDSPKRLWNIPRPSKIAARTQEATGADPHTRVMGYTPRIVDIPPIMRMDTVSGAHGISWYGSSAARFEQFRDRQPAADRTRKPRTPMLEQALAGYEQRARRQHLYWRATKC